MDTNEACSALVNIEPTQPWAHSGGHLLREHLQAVADQAGRFAQALRDGDTSKTWTELAGRWHDLGKYRPGFQRYVRQAEDAHIEHRVAGREKTHSAAGALWAMQQLNQPKLPYGHVLAYLIAGHHAGLEIMRLRDRPVTDHYDTSFSEETRLCLRSQ